MKGYIVNVYRRNGQSCTNGGVSETHDALLLVGEGVPEIFEDKGDLPVVVLKEENGYKYLVPEYFPHNMVGPIFGGNFAYNSDSRINKLFGGRPVPIHDRFDTKKDHKQLSA